ncbi:hypothetical protein F5Y05DRAFT_108418 [Hypoxylon sp. FL0543]|nr:hypothetical protein F5Y05DRAFT_108418 [Hypoxylon sp. FL0543]
MGYTHRDNAQFSRAGWRKRVLLPCWIAQIAILLGVMGLFSYRLSITVRTWKDEEAIGNIPMVEFVWEIVNVAFSFFSLLITFVTIARFIAEVLTPLPLLFANILNMVLASAVLALDIVVYVKYTDRQYSLVGLAMDCALLFFTILPAFYSVVIYRRLLSYDDYHIPGNIKPYGYSSAEESGEMGYHSSWLEPPMPYDPTDPAAMATRPRSISAASSRISLTLNTLGISSQPSPPIVEPPPVERPKSYDHKRDTRFDEYVRRRSNSYTKLDVDRAFGAEFGWEDARDQRESIISSGSVPVSHARARGDSLSTRQASLEASIIRSGSGSTTITMTSNSTANLETPPNGMVRAHSLNSVPEAHEEEDGDVGLGKRKKGEDREALLDGETISPSSSGASRKSMRRMDPVGRLDDVEIESRGRRRGS